MLCCHGLRFASIIKTSNRCLSVLSASAANTANKNIKSFDNEGISIRFQNLRLNDSPLAAHIQATTPSIQNYILPSVQNDFIKKTILDPAISRSGPAVLPTKHRVIEKLNPSLFSVVPMIDPHPHPSTVNPDAVKKECMPYLVRIRKRKMKKHKLRKLRKRMIFVNRKLTEIKKRKKEKIMREYEAMWAKRASDFNAESWVDERLDLARKGGYHVDVWQEYLQKKRGENVTR